MNDQPRPSIADLLTDQDLITAALGRAVREALVEHTRAGRDVAIGKDGKVIWVPARELLARFPAENPE